MNPSHYYPHGQSPNSRSLSTTTGTDQSQYQYSQTVDNEYQTLYPGYSPYAQGGSQPGMTSAASFAGTIPHNPSLQQQHPSRSRSSQSYQAAYAQVPQSQYPPLSPAHAQYLAPQQQAAYATQFGDGSYSAHPYPPSSSSPIAPGFSNAGSAVTIPAATPASPERWPCDKCEKSFSRAHDRKRHYETTHAPNPPSHKCPFCEKAFARADSLKRHVDNGCEKDPSIQN
ncbi:hypothetical protein K474DRAFT_1655867 [Panus rudis PR-1116 ss-1]|nr:hypothetical protein K474DRAFT_1655867 [Panus rudis PR-1116 ss-1]